MLASFDEPFADDSAIPTYFVSRLAREHVTVSLSGDGGDELFAGYEVYAALGSYRAFDRLPIGLRRRRSNDRGLIIPKASAAAGSCAAFPRRRRCATSRCSYGLAPTQGPVRMPGPAVHRLPDDGDDGELAPKLRLPNGSVGDAQRIDQETYMVDDILTKVDRSSMAVSLEARVPLLDHVFADYVNASHSR